MDSRFMHIVAIGLVIIACTALGIIYLVQSNTTFVIALVGIVSTIAGALAGVLGAPKLKGPETTT